MTLTMSLIANTIILQMLSFINLTGGFGCILGVLAGWLSPILQWCVDTRDPANDSTHQWTEHAPHYFSESGPQHGPFSLEKVRDVSAKVYGNSDVWVMSLNCRDAIG